MKKSYIDTIYYFLKTYKVLFICILTASIIVAVLESLSLAALLPLFNSVLGISQQPRAGILFGTIEKVLAILPFEDMLVSSFALLLILVLLKSVFGIFAEFLDASTSGWIMYNTKKALLEKYVSAPYQFFLDTKQGELLYNIIHAPTMLVRVFYRIPRLVLELLKVAAITLLLLYMNVISALILMLLCFGFNVLVNSLSNRFSYSLGKERVSLSTQQTTLINEIFNGIKHIIVYGARGKWETRFDAANKRFTDIFIKDTSLVVVPKYIIEIFGYLSVFCVIIFIKRFHPENFTSSLPVIGIFAMALLKILPSLGNIGRLRMEISGALPDAEVIYKVLNSKFDKVEYGDRAFNGFNDTIALEELHFAHKGRQDLLKGVSITFRKNEITAIVGTTGSGKTTLLNMILGLHQPAKGAVTIDNVNLREYTIESWLEKIGFVSQDSFIFHSTIADNISLGVNKYSMDELTAAAKLSGADDFIRRFPKGYETMVGERGMKLSGGQQQCIAIARAILREPQILILDEATSALDNISEKMIQGAINNISKKYTIIIIAHRLSTVQNADKIVVLKDGVVAESGTHTELMSRDGFYRHMHTAEG